ncbi:MAG: Ig-like domain-containing protein [Oscillospiraceae bacterium]|nr:Ig-like domain-containing protein [Oscillospiraceae bacterium]
MSKIICEVCGTSYPDTTVQCPICGCVRPGNARSVADSKKSEDNGGYTYVKGGRFTKANVRKRGAAVQAAAASSGGNDGKNENRGLVITAIILLIAIIAVVSYIAVQLFLPGNSRNDETTPKNPLPVETTVQTEPPVVPCKSLKLETDTITLEKQDAAWMIYTRVEPSNTTDEIVFTSSDENVATVTNNGKVVAVGAGQAVITVTCGDKTAECKVECVFELPTEETTVPEETTLPEEEFVLNRKDITFNNKGDSWMLYSGSISPTKITWTSGNEAVAKIENGKVTAVGGGTTKVYGEYNGEKVSCIIRCNFAATPDTGVSGSGGVYEDGGVSEDGGSTSTGGNYHLKNLVGNDASDVTLTVGSGFTLALVDANGNEVSGVTWTVSDSSVCTVSGGYVAAVKSGMVTVTATYNGQTYSCIVRVS